MQQVEQKEELLDKAFCEKINCCFKANGFQGKKCAPIANKEGEWAQKCKVPGLKEREGCCE